MLSHATCRSSNLQPCSGRPTESSGPGKDIGLCRQLLSIVQARLELPRAVSHLFHELAFTLVDFTLAAIPQRQ
jgi:hypothetical protein